MMRNAYNEAIGRITKEYMERGDVFSASVINKRNAERLADVTSESSPEGVYTKKELNPMRAAILVLLAQEEESEYVTIYSRDFNTSIYNIKGNRILQIMHDGKKGARDYADLANEIKDSLDDIDRNIVSK